MSKCLRPWCGIDGKFCLDCTQSPATAERASVASSDLDEMEAWLRGGSNWVLCLSDVLPNDNNKQDGSKLSKSADAIRSLRAQVAEREDTAERNYEIMDRALDGAIDQATSYAVALRACEAERDAARKKYDLCIHYGDDLVVQIKRIKNHEALNQMFEDNDGPPWHSYEKVRAELDQFIAASIASQREPSKVPWQPDEGSY